MIRTARFAVARLSLAVAFAGVATAAMAAPETYTLEANHSFARFSYRHLGFSTQESRFDNVTGTVTLDRAAHTGAVDVVIDTKSVSTGSALFNQHIQGPDFLDTAAHPTATFKSTTVRFDGDKPVAVDGQLTLKGVTKRVTLNITAFTAAPHPMNKKDALGADATATLKRSDFNMGKYAPAVTDEVTVSLAIEAFKP